MTNLHFIQLIPLPEGSEVGQRPASVEGGPSWEYALGGISNRLLCHAILRRQQTNKLQIKNQFQIAEREQTL